MEFTSRLDEWRSMAETTLPQQQAYAAGAERGLTEALRMHGRKGIGGWLTRSFAGASGLKFYRDGWRENKATATGLHEKLHGATIGMVDDLILNDLRKTNPAQAAAFEDFKAAQDREIEDLARHKDALSRVEGFAGTIKTAITDTVAASNWETADMIGGGKAGTNLMSHSATSEARASLQRVADKSTELQDFMKTNPDLFNTGNAQASQSLTDTSTVSFWGDTAFNNPFSSWANRDLMNEKEDGLKELLPEVNAMREHVLGNYAAVMATHQADYKSLVQFRVDYLKARGEQMGVTPQDIQTIGKVLQREPASARAPKTAQQLAS